MLEAYQQLVDDQIVETKRGRGTFVNVGARKLLLKGERRRFLAEAWPNVLATIHRLGLTLEDLESHSFAATAEGRIASVKKT